MQVVYSGTLADGRGHLTIRSREPNEWKVKVPKTARPLPPGDVVPVNVVHGPSGVPQEGPQSIYERQQRGDVAPAWGQVEKPASQPVAPLAVPELKREPIPPWVNEPEDHRVDVDPFDHEPEPVGLCPRHGLPLGSFLEGATMAYCICPEETCTVWPMTLAEAASLPIVAVA